MGLRLSTITYGFVIALVVFGCDYIVFERGNGDEDLITYAVDDFDEVFIGGNYDVFLEKGDRPKVVIETDENLFEYIQVEDRNGTLSISNSRKIMGSDGIRVFITFTELDRVVSSGASSIYSNSPLIMDRLRLSMSGAGMIDLEIETEDLEVRLSGAGIIHLEGKADKLKISLTGAGKLEAYDLESRDCDITISGVGGAEVYVTGKLDARVSGLGSISYIGNPEDIRQDVSGIGRIRAAE